MKSYFFSHFITAVTLLLLSFQTQADQWYHVELIIFEQLDTITDEQWPQMVDKPIATTALTPSMATELIQPAVNETLLNIASRLEKTPSYQVHYHRSWQQPIMKKRNSEPVTIRTADNLIEGNLRLHKANYLHASLDLWLKQNIEQENSWSDYDYSSEGEEIEIEAVRNPHLIQSRRIRPKKLYFFDHPKMGALLQLTPIDTPAAVQTANEELETFSLPTEAAPTVSE